MNRREKKPFITLLFILLTVIFACSYGCSQEQDPMVIYVGKGLKKSMKEIHHSFEQQYKIPLSIIYAGSDTLLTTIHKTKKGDIFIPGSATYIEKLQVKVTTSQHLADHIPAFAVRADNPKNLLSFTDLMQTGIKIAVGNKDMCAIGRVAEDIATNSGQQNLFRQNIVVTGSTVNELLLLVANAEVDTALVWTDMLKWPEAEGLQLITIPDAINTPKEIRVAILSTSTNPEQAALFANFMTTEGKKIFAKHGFRVR